jgi:hypothetical protein
MPEGEFHAYVGLLAFSGLVLSVLAIRGFGQRAGSRVADGVFAAGFLGYAAYLIVTDPPAVTVFYYAFAAPVFLLVHMWRERGRARRRRFAAGLIPQTYAAPPAPTPLTPFPPPPPPLGSEPARHERPEHQHHRTTYQPLPSGLPGRSVEPAPGPGLAGSHEAGSGRHRASEPAEPAGEPPSDRPPAGR